MWRFWRAPRFRHTYRPRHPLFGPQGIPVSRLLHALTTTRWALTCSKSISLRCGGHLPRFPPTTKRVSIRSPRCGHVFSSGAFHSSSARRSPIGFPTVRGTSAAIWATKKVGIHSTRSFIVDTQEIDLDERMPPALGSMPPTGNAPAETWWHWQSAAGRLPAKGVKVCRERLAPNRAHRHRPSATMGLEAAASSRSSAATDATTASTSPLISTASTPFRACVRLARGPRACAARGPELLAA